MSRPRVAIVGSVEENRAFDPPVKQHAQARQACAELGGELAKAQCDIVVYSSDRRFIEADVVRGYVDAAAGTTGSIRVCTPIGKDGFVERTGHRQLFDVCADPSPDWEVSFYRSLADCQGVLLVGGGQSTLVAGLVALTMRLPTVAVATFGGSAQKVWERFAHECDDAFDKDVAAMADAWHDGSAHRLVDSLTAQQAARARRQQEQLRHARQEARRAQTSLAVAVLLLAAAVAGLVLAWGWRPCTAGNVAVLVMLPAVAAAAGALIRTSLDAGRQWTRAGVLGGAAGLITGLLFVASQLFGAPDVLHTGAAEGIRRLLFFVVPIGFVAGLTFDAVYGRLRSPADVYAELLQESGASMG